MLVHNYEINIQDDNVVSEQGDSKNCLVSMEILQTKIKLG